MSSRLLAVTAACCLVLSPLPARAQCPDWIAGPLATTGAYGTNGAVFAWATWDPDGDGPLLPVLVVAGAFTSIGGVAANNIAARDPMTGQWQALGAGTDDQIRCLAVYDGELVAGGIFTQAGGQPASYIARWNGSAWQDVGFGTNNRVYSLALYNGALIAGGYFSTAGGLPANHIAAWNGAAWQQLGSGTNDWVVSLMPWSSTLLAGGYFTSAGGVAANRVAQWDGAAWHAMGSGMELEVLALQPFNGELVAGGRFTTAGGVAASRIAAWNGAAWHQLGPGVDNTVLALGAYQGQLVVGGVFTQAGPFGLPSIGRWDGLSFAALGSGTDGGVYSLWTSGDELVAGGSFSQAGGPPAANMARWDGLQWSAFGGGTAFEVLSMTNFMGRLVIGGQFQQYISNGPTVFNIAGWDGAALWPFDSGTDGAVGALLSFKYPGVHGAYELVAGGVFLHAGGIAANRIARRQQTQLVNPPPVWQAMGAGFDNQVDCVERFNGATYAGGSFTTSSGPVSYIARWNEASQVWEPVGAGMDGVVFALKAYNGYLYAGGSFTSAGGVSTGGLARWDGAAWSQVGGFFLGNVYTLDVYGNQLVMAGQFTGINSSPNLAQYDGTSYSTFSTGGANSIVRVVHAIGSRLYVGGDFTTIGGVPAKYVAYWDGAWHAMGPGPNFPVYAFGSFGGEVDVGGAFDTVDSTLVSPRWARYSATGVPWFAYQPGSQTVAPGATVSFTAEPASGYALSLEQWTRNGVPLADGPTGTGSVISGVHSHAVTIANVSHTDWGDYRLVIGNGCANDTSVAGTLTLTGTTGAPPSAGGTAVFAALGPNPARGAARLAFTLPHESRVRVRVHDVTGREVRTLDLGRVAAGAQSAAWDARGAGGDPLRPGLYFVALEVDGRRVGTKRLALVR